MNRYPAMLLLLLAACTSPGTSPGTSSGTSAGTGNAEPTYLFVQTAQSATLENGKLTLTGVSPSMLWFTDRPDRLAGHCEVDQFIEAMTDDPDADSFGKDPPNATLSVFDDDSVTDVAVTLLEPTLLGNTLTYKVKVLDGPDTVIGGPASLFIDPIRRPAATEKVILVHRRGPRPHVRHVAHHW